MNNLFSSKQGYTLLEAILAIALAGVLSVGGLGLFLTATFTSSESARRIQALWQAQEGLSALQTIAFEDLFMTEIGSLSFATNQWTLAASGPETLSGGFSRTVKIQSVQRT